MDFIIKFGTSKAMVAYAIIGVVIVLGVIGFVVWLRFSNLRRVYVQKRVFIEVTPPLEASKTPEATEQLFHILHSVGSTQRLRHKVLRRSIVFSLEVVSSRKEGVRYIICTGEREADAIERSVAAFLSNSRMKRIADPLLAKGEHTKVKEFKQTKHFALPIRTLDTFEQHDSIAYITSAMNRLAPIFEYEKSGKWEAETHTKLPRILLVCSTKRIETVMRKRMTRLADDAHSELAFATSTLDRMGESEDPQPWRTLISDETYALTEV